jgi:hypothetical protein
LLVRTQDPAGDGRVHRSAAFDFVYQRHALSADASGQPSAQSGTVSISRRRIAARLIDLGDDFIVARHADRHER